MVEKEYETDIRLVYFNERHGIRSDQRDYGDFDTGTTGGRVLSK